MNHAQRLETLDSILAALKAYRAGKITIDQLRHWLDSVRAGAALEVRLC